ncbi:DUF833 domain-containing protein [Lophium mytilinum]|uniref:DUF833 domain-containing protein n=1 Tax=Lophium mytilinum TaxID=390894 RepID=A0A6A6R6Q6_9PEZI|nr:DUF833 domain-containing protein [Lophium mytilinum]
MCIAIITTEHPDYPFILLNNRDEYLHRPTAPSTFWPAPHAHVLGGYDLHRAEHGTWLGVTRQGRIACLTNYREEDPAALVQGVRSRGAIVNLFLRQDPSSHESTEAFARRLVAEDGVRGVGGFSLLFGDVRDVVKGVVEGRGEKGKGGLAIISNRTPDVEGLIWVAGGAHETTALSNSFYGDASWPKVVKGEEAVRLAVKASAKRGESKEELLERLFGLLSVDTLPRQRNGEEWDVYLNQLRHSIFVPPIGGVELEGVPSDRIAAAVDHEAVDATSGVYGTQKQSLILVDKKGMLTFVERTLFDGIGKPVEGGKVDRVFEFQVEGW